MLEIYAEIGENGRPHGRSIVSPTSGISLPYLAEIGNGGGAFDIDIPDVPVPVTIACGQDPGPGTPLDCTASCGGKMLLQSFQLIPFIPEIVRARVTTQKSDLATMLFASAGAGVELPKGEERIVEIVLCRIPTRL